MSKEAFNQATLNQIQANSLMYNNNEGTKPMNSRHSIISGPN